MFYVIKPLKEVSFRWGGEFSPTLSGPMNKGVSEPLPMPSTIVGFLRSITGSKRKDVEKLSLDEDLNTVGLKLWGPLLVNNGKYYAHSYPGKLIELNNWTAVKEVDMTEVVKVVSKIGIGVNMDSKSVIESKLGAREGRGYIESRLYTQQFVKINGGIVFEADVSLKEGYYVIGGEGSVVKLEEFKGFKPPEEGKLGLVLSPIILEPKEGLVTIDDLYDVEVKECGKLGDISNYVKVGLLGLGFNIAYNVRRPIYLAIMPGSVINCTKKNAGLFNDKGWGSILPIKDYLSLIHI